MECQWHPPTSPRLLEWVTPPTSPCLLEWVIPLTSRHLLEWVTPPASQCPLEWVTQPTNQCLLEWVTSLTSPHLLQWVSPSFNHSQRIQDFKAVLVLSPSKSLCSQESIVTHCTRIDMHQHKTDGKWFTSRSHLSKVKVLEKLD